MNQLNSNVCACALSLICFGSAQAATVTTTFADGKLFNATQISELTVGSDAMAGMALEMCFFGVSICDTATWAEGTIGASAGDFSGGNGWQMSAGGTDTFLQPFSVSVAGRQLASFTLYGLGSRTVFDTVFEEAVATKNDNAATSSPGSGNGRPFEIVSGAGNIATIAVNYFDKVWVGGSPYDDLYLGMRVSFTMNPGITNNPLRLFFSTDTDSVATGATLLPIPPAPNPVPLPGTLALAGLGLAALGAVSRRRTVR